MTLLSASPGNFRPISYTYADAAARTGASGFVAADVYKVALQLDTGSLWLLTATTPTWLQAGGPGLVPGGGAGGVLSGTYPNPGFAVDMATQAELDGHTGDATAAHAATAISFTPAGTIAATTVQAAIEEVASEAGGGGGGSVATDAIWDAAGDTVYGTGANTAARLAKGTAYQVFRMNAGATAPEWGSPIVARYKTAVAQSFSHATSTIVQYDTSDFDSHSFVTTGAAWKFLPTVVGYYHVSATMIFAATTAWAATETGQLSLFKNGAEVSVIDRKQNHTASSQLMQLSGSDTVSLNGSSDYIDIRLYQDSGGALTLLNNANYNFVSIFRVN